MTSPRASQGDLFRKDEVADDQLRSPLADRVRPQALNEFVGQEHLVGEGKLLRRLLDAGRLPSLIIWGPPGTGKTTLARIVARLTSADFTPISAVSSGVKDLRRAVAEAQELWKHEGRLTILFIDEIHRFNKAQQDAILPHVEDGTVTLIGATTENPSFEVIGPLLSRCRVLTFKSLEPEEIARILRCALENRERGLGNAGVEATDGVLDDLAQSSGGDARQALNLLEAAITALAPDEERRLTSAHVEEALQGRVARYDKKGEMHFDTISAFIKSVRGSDVDAALFWLARMLEAGEDPLFVVRRMVILAAEDIGLADPQALVIATACQQAVHFIGLPEGYLPMAECAIYLAAAPKSNAAYTAYKAALEEARGLLDAPVPPHLRNATTGLDRSLGHGRDYKNPHAHEGHHVEQSHLPEGARGGYYRPGKLGYERRIREWLKALDTGETDSDALEE